jgi:hypothetical protein
MNAFHGPGTGRLFMKPHEMFGDEIWIERAAGSNGSAPRSPPSRAI